MSATISAEGVSLKQTLAEKFHHVTAAIARDGRYQLPHTSSLLPSSSNPKQRTAPSWKESDDLDISSLLSTDGTHSIRHNASFTPNTRF
jgi:hypothetical protein